mmetsp:Transcript_8784/g.18768  ORF Transcript_8784/g.18768 Transcript_8784/m.18768 type:complete len:784 (-) Transcript_8784:787-3138(-)|eukprot:CAMPEP_0202896468 /NCGR_PEP_ID=MMETSP1392-20130828/5468_1 /ASSEMBLY_ACC=CAM_ASM_000868 /TAXON_ID=225041 /ORGANISM="Chlamydomonas chlamydogama, Strain SAG 11-48b" /LENGTH=783 /DNA_ID=CAMNT_0049581839 /DNA_START=22 /DNA_END=2373 /DNA_ORIENTATION=+
MQLVQVGMSGALGHLVSGLLRCRAQAWTSTQQKGHHVLAAAIGSWASTPPSNHAQTFIRGVATLKEVTPAEREQLSHVRNIGISAHIDSGKTTLTERILFYTGKIKDIHEVKGKDGVGAKMDSMELEREKGITIQSAATYCRWKDKQVNIIDTPGHVDFTIEVERSLRVLDGAILVLCGVGGVQSQSITVDRQMKRYNVPRLIFVNKLDRMGSNPWRAIQMAREKLKLNAAAIQIPIGLEEHHQGVVDLVERKAFKFEGPKGDKVVEVPVPDNLKEEMEIRRQELVERLSEVDDEVADLFLSEKPVEAAVMHDAIRRATIGLKFQPVFMGSAFKNRGVQLLLDGVNRYLPSPCEVVNTALDVSKGEAPFALPCSPSGPFVGLAFKLEEGRFGQLTYMRVYSGKVKKGDFIYNMSNNKKVRVPRLVRMHSDEMEDIQEAAAGDIVAIFGVDCASGDTFTDGDAKFAMTSIRVPEPVMSLALTPKAAEQMGNFMKALTRFQKEDPTFRVASNAETGEIIISGMGELHLEIYVERMRREYKVECEVGKPKVSFRETIRGRAEFNYLHKKQSGGAGQFGRVVGYIEALPEGDEEAAAPAASTPGEQGPKRFEFENKLVGNNIPPEFHSAIEKGFKEAANSGALIGAPVENVRVVLTDGASHPVDSSELAFRIASVSAFRQAYLAAAPQVLEPIMKVEITVPSEYQGTVMGDLNRRKGIIMDSVTNGDDCIIYAEVPLNNMFGYSTVLRSNTQGKGEYSMAYSHHSPVSKDLQDELTAHYAKTAKASA